MQATRIKKNAPIIICSIFVMAKAKNMQIPTINDSLAHLFAAFTIANSIGVSLILKCFEFQSDWVKKNRMD